MTAPGIPNDFTLSTRCFGGRLASIEDEVFAAAAMGFRRLELGLGDAVTNMDGLEESERETGVELRSMIVGCRDPQQNGGLASSKLGSLSSEARERALNSVRRHVRLARAWKCPLIIVRGSKTEDAKALKQALELEARIAREGRSAELRAEVLEFVVRLQKQGQRQVEHLCRSLHTLMQEHPDVKFAIEPGVDIDDLLGFDAMGWVLDDLAKLGLGYWHDVGRIHMRERVGLPGQAQWLSTYAPRMLGVHLQDAAEDEAERPLGLGEVDFRIVREALPRQVEKVLEIAPQHGRAQILQSVQFLLDRGF
ncbi:MAG: TIM barrel protein [Planctomycetes bacterium]|nr:TIM barrel protein [Planctomycetota bacterium]